MGLLNPHKMGKRQRNQEEGDEDIGAVPTTAQDPPSKKPRKETNASAQRTLFVRSLPAIATSKAKKGKGGEKEEKKFKPGFPPGEEGRLQRREQIIQKKRMMRRKRKGGA